VCDTVCAVTPGAVLFGKNSDREPGEAQAVELVPARTGLSGALRCTHVEVPQVSRTRAVLLSRPAWMWGCEMGANDAGVVGGNEAVFTRFPVAADGLTGMDLLRLALERSGTAREAAQVVIELLAAHPQGGRMGFRNRGFRYHSSFLFADAREGWVLETAGPYWALERVRGVRTISNALSIGVPDEVHPGAADEARRRGWLARGQDFEFARCFDSPWYRLVTGGPQRQACTTASLASGASAPDVMAVLRDHRGAHPAAGLRLESPCAHASWQPTRHAGQTTGSMVSALSAGGARHFLTGTSAPCLSVFKPASLDVAPDAYGPPAPEKADAASVWWRHERLHRAVLESWDARAPRVEAPRAALEARLLASTDVQAAWDAHRDVLPSWLEAASAGARAGGAPLFGAWWRRQRRLDFPA
jgi:dipeptidase